MATISEAARELINRQWEELCKLLGYKSSIPLGDFISSEQSKDIENLGTGAGVLKEFADNSFFLKSIKEGQNIVVDNNTDEIVINAVQSTYGNHVVPATGSRADLVTAIESLSGNNGTVHIVQNTTIDTANVTVPSNVHLIIEPTAKLIGSNDKKIIVDGTLEASAHQIFQGFGATDVVLRGPIDRIYPQWFGAKADGVTDDTAAIQAAINAAKIEISTASKTVYFLPGVYLVKGTLTVSGTGTLLVGEHWRKSAIRHSPIVANTDCVVFEYATPYGHGNGFQGLLVESTTTNSRRLLSVINQHTFAASDFYVSGGGFAKTGIYLDYLVNCVFKNFKSNDFSGVGCQGVESGLNSSTTCSFKKGYIGSNKNGMVLNGSTWFLEDTIIESNSNVGIFLEAANVDLSNCHFENNPVASIYSGTSGNINSYRSIYLVGISGTPTAQIDIKSGKFNSFGDSWSGNCPLVRLNRDGVKQLNTEAAIFNLNIPFNFPDVVEIVKDDSGVIAGTPSWKDHSSLYGQFCGSAPIIRESSAVLNGGVSSLMILSDGGARWLLNGSITVDKPTASNGSTPTTQTLHNKRFQFMFEQGAGGGKTVAFNPTYWKLLQAVPNGAIATAGQRLTVWFKYEADIGLWVQDTPFLGWG
jgi:hypothetical protein